MVRREKGWQGGFGRVQRVQGWLEEGGEGVGGGGGVADAVEAAGGREDRRGHGIRKHHRGALPNGRPSRRGTSRGKRCGRTLIITLRSYSIRWTWVGGAAASPLYSGHLLAGMEPSHTKIRAL